jgi:tetratricopeptide (TPR) repeat protein
MSLVLGEPEDALDAFQRAMRLNPLDVRAVPLALFGSSAACLLLTRFNEGIDWARKLLAVQPSDFRGHFTLLANFLELGNDDVVEEIAKQMRQDFPHMRSSALRLAYRQRRADFKKVIDRAIARIGLPE